MRRKPHCFERAADFFVRHKIPHVCWAVAKGDGFPTRCYRYSPAAKWFQRTFAAPGAKILQTGDMLNVVDSEEGLREFSLMLLAFAAAMEEYGDV